MATTGKIIKVDTAQLTTAATQIEGIAGDYKKKYEEIYTAVGNLTSKYKSSDITAFAEQVNALRDDFDKMHKLIDSYVVFLKNSAKAYEDTAKNRAEAAKQLTKNM